MRNLTQREIVDKDFNTKFRGINPEEVDQFLDLIIEDYRSFDKEISQLKKENERLIQEVDELSEQVDRGVGASKDSPSQSTATNFDILKRLSNLERHVFGDKLTENK